MRSGVVYQDARAVTPSDTVNINTNTHALLVGGAGTLSVVTEGGTTVSITAIAGQLIPIAATRVNATGTTATGIVALRF